MTGVGLAAVRPDDERPHNLKQLAAIRAAKLEAIRSLAEQVQGWLASDVAGVAARSEGQASLAPKMG